MWNHQNECGSYGVCLSQNLIWALASSYAYLKCVLNVKMIHGSNLDRGDGTRPLYILKVGQARYRPWLAPKTLQQAVYRNFLGAMFGADLISILLPPTSILLRPLNVLKPLPVQNLRKPQKHVHEAITNVQNFSSWRIFKDSAVRSGWHSGYEDSENYRTTRMLTFAAQTAEFS